MISTPSLRSTSLAAVLLAALAAPLAGQDRTVTLEEALSLAEKAQPSVIQAIGALDNAEAQLRTSRGAYLPNLTLSSNGSTSFSAGTSRINPTTGELISGNRSNTSVSMGLSSSVDLFTGFRRGADVRAARATREAATSGLVDARAQVRLLATQQFLDALAAKTLTRVRDASVRRAEEQLKTSIAKLQAGTATRSDSLRSLVTLGTARLQLVSTGADLAQAEAALARLIGVDGRVAAADDSSYYVAAPLDTVGLRAQAEEQSPQVQSARAAADAARASLAASRSAYWPSLSLGAGTSWNGSNSSDYQLFNQRQLTLSLSWNIFNRFSREQTIALRDNALDVALAQADDLRRQVQAALTAQLAQLDAATVRLDITGTSLVAAEEDVRVQGERYRLGASTIVDVLTSQEALTQAEVDQVNARFDYLRAKAQIEALIGRPL